MAELCRECFIEIWRPDKYEISRIVMSKDNGICEGCMNYGPYVETIRGTLTDYKNDKPIDFDYYFGLIMEERNEQT